MSGKSYEKSYTGVRKQILGAPHHFALLGVHRRSTVGELSIARRLLQKHVHPDVNSAPDAQKLSALVNAAHAALESDMDGYVRSLMKKPCATCAGAGTTKKQKGFSMQILTICWTCHGAGVV